MSKYDIGRLVKRRSHAPNDTDIGIILSERLKETFDDNGYGGCYVPQVLVAWKGLDKQQWIARKRLHFSYESKEGTPSFT